MRVLWVFPCLRQPRLREVSLTQDYTKRKVVKLAIEHNLTEYHRGLVVKSCPTLATAWTVACQAPLSMEFSRKEYQTGLPFSSPGDLPNPGVKPASPALAGGFLTTELPGKPHGKLFSKNGDKGIVHCKLGLPGPLQGVSR